MKKKLTSAVMTLLLTIGVSSAAAYADTLTFTLSDPTQIAYTGTAVTYIATVTNTSNTVEFLNSDSFNVASPLALDDNDFLNNFPLSLNPGATFTGDLFTIDVPGDAPLGTYLGTFTLVGGADGGTFDVLGEATFGTTVTPEPSSLLLFGSGLFGLVGVARRRWQR